MTSLLSISNLACSVVEYSISMINRFVAQGVKTYYLMPACLLVLVTGFSTLVL